MTQPSFILRVKKPERSFESIMKEALAEEHNMTREDKDAMLEDLKVIETALRALGTFPSITLLIPVRTAIHNMNLRIENLRKLIGE